MRNESRALALLALAAAVASAPGCNEESPATPSLGATCSASPASGPAPLTVSFGLNVTGAQGAFTVAIQYGDGASGTDPGAAHTYRNPGAYTATFTVATATQSALCSAPVRVETASTPAPSPSPSPSGGANQAPDAVFRTEPDAQPGGLFTGTAPLTIQFNMCASRDPEQDPLRYRMDFTGDGEFEVDGLTGGDCRRSYRYRPGRFHPRLCVTDLDRRSLGTLHPFQCHDYTVRLR